MYRPGGPILFTRTPRHRLITHTLHHLLITSSIHSSTHSHTLQMALQYTNYEVIPYDVDFKISMYWETGLDVIKHLLDNPDNCRDLLEEVKRKAQAQPRHILIYHPLLSNDIMLHPHHNDLNFLNQLHCLGTLEIMEKDP